MTAYEANDLLASLLDAIEDQTMMAWCVRWAADGTDPIQEAWEVCTADETMVYLLEAIGVQMGPWWCEGSEACRRINSPPCPGCSEVIRSNYATPNLAHVLSLAEKRSR